MILFLETEILAVPNIEKDNASERGRGTESRSDRQTLKTRDKLKPLIKKSKFFIFDL